MEAGNQGAACFNCGLPDAKIRAKVWLTWVTENRPHNYLDGGRTTIPSRCDLRRPSRRTLPFCNEECAAQTMFLQLAAHATKDSITRYLAGKPIAYSDFRRMVPVETVEGRLDRYETPLQVADFTDSKRCKNGNLMLPLMNRKNRGFRNAGGRPRKYETTAEKQRAYRDRIRFDNRSLGASAI